MLKQTNTAQKRGVTDGAAKSDELLRFTQSLYRRALITFVTA